ncbi:hypothetical protein [Aneurinibacillus sp. REN35]|uniref:hypothetical protein n=1 Tax=Aneurinibacillus sp. REN35 TaxID=3237286 RepID=UPI003528E8C3
MKWQRIAAVLLTTGGLLMTGTGCSSIDTRSPSAQTEEAKSWIAQQMKLKQASINEWEKMADQAKSSPADQAVSQLAVNVLSKNVASLIAENGKNKPALLASVMKKEKVSEPTNLPSLASLTLAAKNQLDGGKTLYRLEGKVFTSVPERLYPVTIVVRVSKQGHIEYFDIDR